ncbi:adenosine monophosphate-protein transferase FICD [Striga asiatica]|uniref:Adenosine monophosphate-protein transferase FICD n=1 Tax=Striga asiatica TaxID=4170 RepID=A0A5A7Q2I8_STRAF|nr:adenosine monophosphate-protein transferase FICD [Striga asiatica]
MAQTANWALSLDNLCRVNLCFQEALGWFFHDSSYKNLRRKLQRIFFVESDMQGMSSIFRPKFDPFPEKKPLNQRCKILNLLRQKNKKPLWAHQNLIEKAQQTKPDNSFGYQDITILTMNKNPNADKKGPKNPIASLAVAGSKSASASLYIVPQRGLVGWQLKVEEIHQLLFETFVHRIRLVRKSTLVINRLSFVIHTLLELANPILVINRLLEALTIIVIHTLLQLTNPILVTSLLSARLSENHVIMIIHNTLLQLTNPILVVRLLSTRFFENHIIDQRRQTISSNTLNFIVIIHNTPLQLTNPILFVSARFSENRTINRRRQTTTTTAQ